MLYDLQLLVEEKRLNTREYDKLCAPQTYALIYAQVKDPVVTPPTEKSN